MKRLQRLAKLERLEAYLRNITLPDDGVTVSYVTAQDAATSLLNAAAGIQVLVARPECRQNFGSDGVARSTDMETVVFVLQKSLGAGNTPERELALFDRCLELCDDILSLLFADAEGCNLGLELTGIDLRPEVSVFGGWSGYSLSISFS